MRDSEIRIKEYQKRLPDLRAKVVSMAMFFVISIIMMTSATFAWLTVSTSPEVEGIATTVTANGNLEIALARPNGSQPEESMVGDSNLELALRNLTWGNLVNLSDPSYGMENIILRPASLNRSSLLQSPLFAADYSEDGRIETLTSDFAYSNYDIATGEFLVPLQTQYGVRAISSVTYTFAGGAEAFVSGYQAATNTHNLAKSQYQTLTGNSEYMNAISSMMGDFLTNRFTSGETNFSPHIPKIYEMMIELNACIDTTADAVVQVANMQSMVAKGGNATTYTLTTLFKASNAELSASGVNIEGLDVFKTNYDSFKKHVKTMEGINKKVTENGANVYWSEISTLVNFLVHIDSVVVDGTEVKDIGMSEAAGMVLGGGDHKAVITKGMLFDMEQFLGTYMYAEKLPVKVTVEYNGSTIGPVTLKANVYTAASPVAYLQEEITEIKNTTPNLQGKDPVAADTYGLAVDFWVRTNAEEDYLILEGNVLTVEVQKTDKDGNLYFTDEDGNVVIQSQDGKYSYEDGTEAPSDNLKITYEQKVIGYEGENRVWDDATMSQYSTTQGNGSCYIFYANTPQAQAQSLEVLDAMSVVFIDQDGTLLAEAQMDVESYYAESGRVTVPLKLRSNSINLGTDEDGNTIYAITELTAGEPKLITALIYVDGEQIDNTEVLADGSISGKLNIQFGSHASMEPINDTSLKNEEVTLSAEVDGGDTEFSFATDKDDKGEIKTNITLTVGGITPQTVKANFIRQINSTQGSIQSDLIFTKQSTGVYKATAIFTAPGTYVLRSVWLDGIEYELPDNQKITITIDGFGIVNVSWTQTGNYAYKMSADNAHTEKIYVTLSGLVPNKVQGVFANEENQQVFINFAKGSTGIWSGDARFTTSGVYKMEYLIIDGQYYEIPANMKKTIELSLGMKAKVQVSQTVLEEFTGNPAVELQVYATIMDNKGNELTGLSDVSIQYLQQGTGMAYTGLYSDLEWVADRNRYEGKFSVAYAGAFEFGYLNIGTSSINSAEAPYITAVPKEPPSYYGNLTAETIFAYGTDVNMKVTLADSSAILNGNITAAIQKVDETGNVLATIQVPGMQTSHINTEEDGNLTNLTDWIFEIPTTDELEISYGLKDVTQLGTWQMTELSIVGAYYNGALSTKEDPMIIDVSGKNIVTTVDDKMNVKVTGTSQTLSADKLFMEAHSVSEGLEVLIQGAGGKDINTDLISDVKVTYVLDTSSISTTNSSTKAGYYYTGNSDASLKANLKAVGTTTIALRKDPDSNSFMINPDAPMTLPLEGTYKMSTVQFTIGKTVYFAKNDDATVDGAVEVPLNASSNAPMFSFEWDAPVVKITGVSPTNVTVNTGKSDYLTKKNIPTATKTNTVSNDGYSCDVYFKVETGKDDFRIIWFGTVESYTPSKVETEILNVSEFLEAKLTVDGTEHDVSFTYTKESLRCNQDAGASKDYSTTIVGRKIGTKNRVFVDGVGTYIEITSSDTSIMYIFKLDNGITINTPESSYE